MSTIIENEQDMPNTNSLRKRIGRLVRRFSQDERGVSTIEFAVVSPFLIALWAGTSLLLSTEHTTTKIGKVTAVVADIIAQSPSVNGEYINAAFDAGSAMMGEVAAADLKIYVAGIEVNNDQTIDVKWICGRHFSEEQIESATDTLELPAELMQTPGFIVASYGEYTHTPLHIGDSSPSHTYEYRNYFVPRTSLETLSEGCDG